MKFEDILYEVRNGVAWITINRPDKMNAFRGAHLRRADQGAQQRRLRQSVGVIVLGGAGDRAFCTGGDQSAHDGHYDGRGTIGLPMEELHTIIRDVPKPVIARVQGYAIGGGNVLCTICDLTIAPTRPCSARSARRWARSIPASAPLSWRAWSAKRRRARSGTCAAATRAQEAVAMGLVNTVVPHDQLDADRADAGGGDLRAQPDRDCHRQAFIQCRQREHPRHRGDGNAGAQSLLPHRRIARRRACVQRKAQARFPSPCEITR